MRPARCGFGVKRHQRIAGRLRQPHRAWLRDLRGTAGPIERERHALRLHVADQLQQRLRPAARRRSARRAVAELRDDPRDPLAIVVLARDDDDAAALKVDRGGKDPAMPERMNGMQPASADRVDVLGAADLPLPGRTERAKHRIPERRNRGDLRSLAARGLPVTPVAPWARQAPQAPSAPYIPS